MGPFKGQRLLADEEGRPEFVAVKAGLYRELRELIGSILSDLQVAIPPGPLMFLQSESGERTWVFVNVYSFRSYVKLLHEVIHDKPTRDYTLVSPDECARMLARLASQWDD